MYVYTPLVTHVHIHTSVFPRIIIKRVTTTPIYQPHPLTTPIMYTLIMLAALYIKLLLYRSDVQPDYLIQTNTCGQIP